MPMPSRQIIGGEQYRYAYQGQEKDPETGKEAFELRLWDGRIGRWLTTDPKGQYHSLYLGMGNNPISSIDPDGGSTEQPDDWIKVNGEIIYVDSINNLDDFNAYVKANGLDGAKYLGKTYQEGNCYYSLFGEELDLTTFKGKYTKLIDNTIINWALDLTNPDIDSEDGVFYPRYENFDLKPFKKGGQNNYSINYNGLKGTYTSFINARYGRLEFNINNLKQGSYGHENAYGLNIIAFFRTPISGQRYSIIKFRSANEDDILNFIYEIHYKFNLTIPGTTPIKP